MSKRLWIVGARASTSHRSPHLLAPDRAERVVDAARGRVGLDIMIVVAREAPGVFSALARPDHGRSHEVFLRYFLLSNLNSMDGSDLVVDSMGKWSAGWGEWVAEDNEVEETFRFACPNNLSTYRKTLGRVEELLVDYRFDGVQG